MLLTALQAHSRDFQSQAQPAADSHHRVLLQIDKQAADRCHRLGQTRLVTIHKLVSPFDSQIQIMQNAHTAEATLPPAGWCTSGCCSAFILWYVMCNVCYHDDVRVMHVVLAVD